MLFYIWIAAFVAAVYLYCRQVYSRFAKHGVKHLEPVPLLGNMTPVLLRNKHFIDIVIDLYNKFPEERFVGSYEFMKPVVLIRDIELLKKVTVKDYDHFLDHRSLVDNETDPLMGRNLFALKGQEWKDMRSTLSPAFTSSKMKQMLPFIVEVGNAMVVSLDQELKQSKSGYIDIEGKDLSSHYANDVVASCSFGLKVNSHAYPENEFYKMGCKSTYFGIGTLLKFFGYASFPKLMKFFKLALFPDDVKNFFNHLVLSTMRDREAHNIFRPDMIHILMEIKKGQLAHDDGNSVKDADAGFATVEESTVGKKIINRAWSEGDLIAQAVIFFMAGFETVSTAMTFMLYELAVNPEVQDRLAKEVREHETSGGKFDYNSIQSMTYMDMVVSEVLRLWPPVIVTDRQCSEDYNLGRPNDKATKDFILKKGEGLSIPVAALHRDPRYFPNPMKFDPERFSEENKHKIQPFTYLPFGVGPRNCIATRFALCEVKVMVYQMVQRYELMPCERTTIPCQMNNNALNLRIKGGHWLRIKPRA